MSRPNNKVAVIGFDRPEKLFARDSHALRFAKNVRHYFGKEAPPLWAFGFLAAITHLDFVCLGIVVVVNHGI